MTWFQQLTGLTEESPAQVRSQLKVEGEHLLCPNGTRLVYGRLETPSLGELRARVEAQPPPAGELKLGEVVGDVRQLHANPANAQALFQVASQFNLLEMTGPSVTPERGVGIYEHDRTQGPACAIACGAGTIYRNYFAPMGDQVGQSAERQIDCAAELGTLLGNSQNKLWTMENGYLFPTAAGLPHIASTLQAADEAALEKYRASLRIGLQWNSAVTLAGASHCVSQAYCSALPVAYGQQPAHQWTEFARLILEAAYEATLCAALLNHQETGSPKLYLTLLGGGVFGNADAWIMQAIHRAAERYRAYALDVAIVSYGSSKPAVAQLVAEWG